MISQAKLASIKMLVSSVDGILTDGTVTYGNDTDIRTFHVRDGLATRLAAWNNFPVAWLSARIMKPINRRGEDICVSVYPGISDKEAGLRLAVRNAGFFSFDEIAFVGYDINDIPAMRLAGFPIAVANAAPEVKALAVHVTDAPGGQGALREVIEMIFRAQGRWEDAIDVYLRNLKRSFIGQITVRTEE